MPEPTLFALPEPEPRRAAPPIRLGDVRIVRPVRNQVQFVPQTLDELLPDDHPARAIWGLLEQLDLCEFYAEIAAVVDGPGRPATDPQVLLAVWLLATAEGIGSARQVARLCTEHAAYRWLCGGVPVNYHTLSDFRVGRQAQLDDLLTQILAGLLVARLVTLQQVALAAVPQVQATKARQRTHYSKPRAASVTEPRLSSTDPPDARVMKMPDGGFRPAYNVELATDAAHGIVVGVAVTNAGGDAGQAEAAPMEAQVARRTGRHPQAYLMDGGFATRPDITRWSDRGSCLCPRAAAAEPPPAHRYAPRPGDSPEVVRWRARMQTTAAQQVYRQRGATAEWTNAQLRQHGLTRFTVRGLAKVTTVMLLVAISHNPLRWASVPS